MSIELPPWSRRGAATPPPAATTAASCPRESARKLIQIEVLPLVTDLPFGNHIKTAMFFTVMCIDMDILQ